jgi:SNF2 family DNA or RNA helicase
VVYAGDGKEIVLPNTGRINETREIIEQAGGKVIVFVPFKAVLRKVAAELGKEFRVGTISGETSANERAETFKQFQNQGGNIDVLVAQPAAMSHGLTLTAANTIVWFAPVCSNETYSQANARITRPGQKLTQFIVHIEGSPVERRIYQRLKDRQRLEGMLLELLKETNW